jgi:hypothetical protein
MKESVGETSKLRLKCTQKTAIEEERTRSNKYSSMAEREARDSQRKGNE